MAQAVALSARAVGGRDRANQNASIPAWFDGVPPRDGVEIGRLALLPEVAGRGETFSLARAFRLLMRTLPEVRAVLSYADPMERHDHHGNLVKRGHTGTIYAGAAYAERQLVEMGAPERMPFEDSAAYVARALRSGAFRRVRHPGNYAFGWWLGHSRDNPLPMRGASPYPHYICTDRAI